jgi:hypothetical protein
MYATRKSISVLLYALVVPHPALTGYPDLTGLRVKGAAAGKRDVS